MEKLPKNWALPMTKENVKIVSQWYTLNNIDKVVAYKGYWDYIGYNKDYKMTDIDIGIYGDNLDSAGCELKYCILITPEQLEKDIKRLSTPPTLENLPSTCWAVKNTPETEARIRLMIKKDKANFSENFTDDTFFFSKLNYLGYNSKEEKYRSSYNGTSNFELGGVILSTENFLSLTDHYVESTLTPINKDLLHPGDYFYASATGINYGYIYIYDKCWLKVNKDTGQGIDFQFDATTNTHWELREVTEDERIYIDACVKADKLIPKTKALKLEDASEEVISTPVIGTWYLRSPTKDQKAQALVCYQREDSCYGFNHNREWTNVYSSSWDKDNRTTVADRTTIEEALIKYAKEHYPNGTQYYDYNLATVGNVDKFTFYKSATGVTEHLTDGYGDSVYENGKWARKEPKSVEKPVSSELKKGFWYTIEGTSQLIYRLNDFNNFGVVDNSWVPNSLSCSKGDWKKASGEDVTRILGPIIEVKYPKGTKFISRLGNELISTGVFRHFIDSTSLGAIRCETTKNGTISGTVLNIKGEWAKIIPEEKITTSSTEESDYYSPGSYVVFLADGIQHNGIKRGEIKTVKSLKNGTLSYVGVVTENTIGGTYDKSSQIVNFATYQEAFDYSNSLSTTFQVGDVVFLPEYRKGELESRDWSKEAKIPLNTPLTIKTIEGSGNWASFEGFRRFSHELSKFKHISELTISKQQISKEENTLFPEIKTLKNPIKDTRNSEEITSLFPKIVRVN